MKYYKELLLKKLVDTGWELTQQDDDTDWWLESYWKLTSVKQNYGHEIYVLFLVDPQYDGQNKGSAVWAVGAYEQIPTDRPLEDGVSIMDMVKGKLGDKLSMFVKEINEHRNEIHS
ncbi:MAG: hypothetical protein K6L81_18085 [Agarilytica sp.]